MSRSKSARRVAWLQIVLSMIVIAAVIAGCGTPAATTDTPAVEQQPTVMQEEPTEVPAVDEPTEVVEETPMEEATPVAEAPELDLDNFSPDIAEPSEPVTVTFVSWVGGSPSWQLLAEEFNKIYPNITIEFQDVPFEEITTKLLTQVAANNPPDVAYLDSGSVVNFASRNALVALDDYVAKSSAVDLEDYVPAFIQSAQYEGSTYGLPIDGESTGLFYRTDRFEEAGLDPNKPPQTWEELQEYAEKLTDPENKKYGYILFATEAAYYFYPFLWQAGANVMNDDRTDITWDSPEGLKAAEYYVNLKNYSPEDFLASNSWDGRVAFANGDVAMYMAGAWFAGVLLNEFPDATGLWATAPLPQDEKCATTIAGDSLVIFEASKNKDAAYKWIEFVSSPRNMAYLNLGVPGAPATLLPPRKSLLDDPKTFEANPILKGFADNMQCAVVNEDLPETYGEMETALNDALGRAIYGEVDAATALQEAAEEARMVLER